MKATWTYITNFAPGPETLRRAAEWKCLSDAIWTASVRIAEISNIETAALLEDHTDSLIESLEVERRKLEVSLRKLEAERDELKAQYWKGGTR